MCGHEILLCQADVQSLLSGDALSVGVSVFFWQGSPKLSGSIIGLYVQFFVVAICATNVCVICVCSLWQMSIKNSLLASMLILLSVLESHCCQPMLLISADHTLCMLFSQS